MLADLPGAWLDLLAACFGVPERDFVSARESRERDRAGIAG